MFFLKTIVKTTSDVYGFNIINVLDLLQRALKQPPMPEEVPEEAIKQMVGYMISWHLVENLKTPTLLDLQVDKGKDIIWFWWFNKCNSKTARSVSGHWASKTMRLSWRKCECTQSPINRNFTMWDVENPRHSNYEPICYQVFAGYLSLSFSFTKESPECSYQASGACHQGTVPIPLETEPYLLATEYQDLRQGDCISYSEGFFA